MPVVDQGQRTSRPLGEATYARLQRLVHILAARLCRTAAASFTAIIPHTVSHAACSLVCEEWYFRRTSLVPLEKKKTENGPRVCEMPRSDGTANFKCICATIHKIGYSTKPRKEAPSSIQLYS